MDKSTTLPLSHQPTVALPAQVLVPAAPSTIETINVDDNTTDDSAPSRLALLQRAAELGPGPRLSLDNIGMAPTDPILAKKREPGVIERRTRFRRIVKVALAGCAASCVFAIAATALSSSKPSETTHPTTATHHSIAPASVVSEKATFEVASTTKIEKTASATPAPAAPRGRWAKRR